MAVSASGPMKTSAFKKPHGALTAGLCHKPEISHLFFLLFLPVIYSAC